MAPVLSTDTKKGIKIYSNSVIAECERTSSDKSCVLKRYREFVVYDRHQTYPEFLIQYQRLWTYNKSFKLIILLKVIIIKINMLGIGGMVIISEIFI